MKKFNKIVANAHTGVVIGYIDDYVILFQSRNAFEEHNYFCQLDILDIYNHDDIYEMYNLLILVQLYWQKIEGNFKRYSKYHNSVKDYIFQNFNGIKAANDSKIDEKIYQHFLSQ